MDHQVASRGAVGGLAALAPEHQRRADGHQLPEDEDGDQVAGQRHADGRAGVDEGRGHLDAALLGQREQPAAGGHEREDGGEQARQLVALQRRQRVVEEAQLPARRRRAPARPAPARASGSATMRDRARRGRAAAAAAGRRRSAPAPGWRTASVITRPAVVGVGPLEQQRQPLGRRDHRGAGAEAEPGGEAEHRLDLEVRVQLDRRAPPATVSASTTRKPRHSRFTLAGRRASGGRLEWPSSPSGEHLPRQRQRQLGQEEQQHRRRRR